MTVPPTSERLAITDQLTWLFEQGVLTPADLHVTDTIARLTDERRADVLLATALAVRAPRLGHVCLDLPRIREVGLAAEGDHVVPVAWPELETWLEALRGSASVRGRDDHDAIAPLVLDGHRLYLDRYWRYEQRLVERLHELLHRASDERDPVLVSQHLDVLFEGDEDGLQRRAAEVATRQSLTVLTGGPGTGKTTTVVRLLATLLLTAPEGTRPRMVLAAPTGKAAARMAEAIRAQAASLPVSVDITAELQRLPAVTLHRLLGWRPSAPTRFRHDRRDPVPYDLVVVDEASMASLPIMTKLVDALGPGTRLVLVGDRDQLASVDAGAVLSDVCGPRDVELRASPPRLADSIVTLTRFHRFGANSGIGAAARAIQRIATDGDAAIPDALAVFHAPRNGSGGPEHDDDVALVTPAASGHPLPPEVLETIIEGYAQPIQDALDGRPPSEVLGAFDRLRVLTALRRGPDGVDALTGVISHALAVAVPGYLAHESFPVGQPIMVTRNDHQIRLYNGDVGVVVRDPGDHRRRRVAFPTADGGVRMLSPSRLPGCEPVFAMSVHKSQGSQFDRVVLVLPRVESPLLSRELIYTGVTRAAQHLTVVADVDVLTAGLGRAVQRASGLTERLWYPSTTTPNA